MSTSPLTASATPYDKVALDDAQNSPDRLGTIPPWRSFVILLFALLLGLAYLFNPPVNVEPHAGVIMELPVFIGDYFGKKGEITQAELGILPKDTEFARRLYDDGKGHQINCSIVLSGAEQRSIHRPEGCLVGQGWSITRQQNIPITLNSGHQLVIRQLALERLADGPNGDKVKVRALFDYWFVGQNITTPSHWTRIMLNNWDRVFYNRAHRWAYVSVFSLITDNLMPNGLNPDQTQAELAEFTKKVVPTFQINEMPNAQASN